MFPPYGETNGAHSRSAFPCIYTFKIYKGTIRSRGRSGACNQVRGERLRIPASQLGVRLCGGNFFLKRPRLLRSNLHRLALGAGDTCYGGLAYSIPDYKWLAAAPLKTVEYVEDEGVQRWYFFLTRCCAVGERFFFFLLVTKGHFNGGMSSFCNAVFFDFFLLQDVNNISSMLSANMDRG